MQRKNCCITVMLMGLFAACASAPKNPIDRGIYNPDNVPEESLSTLYIHDFISIQEMNGEAVDWSVPRPEPQIVKIPPGLHSFAVKYHDGSVFTPLPMTVIGEFDSNKTYLLKGTINGQWIDLHILQYENGQEGEEVALDLKKLRGGDTGVIPAYIKYVLNPTMANVKNSVKLENKDYILLFLPDMAYTLTDKKTGKTAEGRRGFSIDVRMTNGKTFLLETDITKMSSEQFLESNYEDNAQIILAPVNCTMNEVTYKYERPDNLRGTEIVFEITEIKK